MPTKNTVNSRHRRRPLGITIVSKNAEPLVQGYLRRAGVSTHGSRSVERAADMTPASASAVVLFADDFRFDDVVTALVGLRARHPKVLVVLVTAERGPFLSLPPSNEGGLLVLPTPVRAWTILDAIRAHLEPARAPEGPIHRNARTVRQP